MGFAANVPSGHIVRCRPCRAGDKQQSTGLLHLIVQIPNPQQKRRGYPKGILFFSGKATIS